MSRRQIKEFVTHKNTLFILANIISFSTVLSSKHKQAFVWGCRQKMEERTAVHVVNSVTLVTVGEKQVEPIVVKNLFPYITTNERAAIITVRTSQLSDDAPTLLPNYPRNRLCDEMDIAAKELHNGYLDDWLLMRRFPKTSNGENVHLCVRVGDLKLKRNY